MPDRSCSKLLRAPPRSSPPPAAMVPELRPYTPLHARLGGSGSRPRWRAASALGAATVGPEADAGLWTPPRLGSRSCRRPGAEGGKRWLRGGRSRGADRAHVRAGPLLDVDGDARAISSPGRGRPTACAASSCSRPPRGRRRCARSPRSPAISTRRGALRASASPDRASALAFDFRPAVAAALTAAPRVRAHALDRRDPPPRARRGRGRAAGARPGAPPPRAACGGALSASSRSPTATRTAATPSSSRSASPAPCARSLAPASPASEVRAPLVFLDRPAEPLARRGPARRGAARPRRLPAPGTCAAIDGAGRSRLAQRPAAPGPRLAPTPKAAPERPPAATPRAPASPRLDGPRPGALRRAGARGPPSTTRRRWRRPRGARRSRPSRRSTRAAPRRAPRRTASPREARAAGDRRRRVPHRALPQPTRTGAFGRSRSRRAAPCSSRTAQGVVRVDPATSTESATNILPGPPPSTPGRGARRRRAALRHAHPARALPQLCPMPSARCRSRSRCSAARGLAPGPARPRRALRRDRAPAVRSRTRRVRARLRHRPRRRADLDRPAGGRAGLVRAVVPAHDARASGAARVAGRRHAGDPRRRRAPPGDRGRRRALWTGGDLAQATSCAPANGAARVASSPPARPP